VGTAGGGLSLEYSVAGEIDSAAVRGQAIGFRLRVMSENAPDTVFEGAIQL
jgi:hypothetical protein